MAARDDTNYGLGAFRKENAQIKAVLSHVRYDIASCDTLMEGDLDPQLAERLSHDLELMMGVFLHYSCKEQLVLPCLERHAEAKANSAEGQSAGGHPAASYEADAMTSIWENDNRVRGTIAMAASLMPGAGERPSAGNLQSVANQLEEACDTADAIAEDEEASLIPSMQSTLEDADWALIATGISTVRVPKVEDGTTWGPGPLDMAEARLRANSLGSSRP